MEQTYPGMNLCGSGSLLNVFSFLYQGECEGLKLEGGFRGGVLPWLYIIEGFGKTRRLLVT